jgi:DNA-binding IclR family transcriptional regulator
MQRIVVIREAGRSTSSSETYEGVSSEGIAIRDPDRHEIIGVAISFPTVMGTPELREKISGLLMKMKTDLMRVK